jgi:hypothetical protein
MKVFRITIAILFVLVTGVYTYFYFTSRLQKDTTYPVITFDKQMLDVSVSATDADLLQGISAFDGKDGDLTDSVLVEKISNFIEKGVSNITYAVADDDYHVTKASRKIRYIGYESPHFTFSQAMRFPLGSSFSILDIIGAEDILDGNIARKIKITSSELVASAEGVYQMRAQVTNSKGDVSYLSFFVTMYKSGRNEPEIVLSDYLIYLHIGDQFDAASFISKVTRNNEVLEGLNIRIDSDVNTAQAGYFQADYYVTDEFNVTATTSLIVIVGV